ncbi:peptidylprolyl isomerase [Paraliobacillus sediminis]|uniref:peptidylprolyl isomerase n=1 Tax=Paraliobacillus sediminis TaxID=1885916 RepID=UPI000E3DD653|nr:peptidylprolyl isomerase [Paraliobacillus sediminis]
MKKLAIAATIAAGMITLSACSSEDSETVVETDSGNITQEEFYEELKTLSGSSVLEQMVMQTILEDNYEVDEDQLDEQLQTYKDQYGEQWETILQSSGYADEDAFREDLKTQLLQQEALIEDVEVTDEEIEQRYERMQTEVEARHILVADEATATDIKSQLDEGADFATLAEENSTDTASAAEGGSLGYFTAGDMVAPFEEVAYGLEVDAISDPVETVNGWHIIQVTDKRDAEEAPEPLEDIRDDVRDDIALTKVDETTSQAKLDQLMEDANIDVKIEEFEDLFTAEEETAAEEVPATEE